MADLRRTSAAATRAANDNEPRRDRRPGRSVSLLDRLLDELMYAG